MRKDVLFLLIVVIGGILAITVPCSIVIHEKLIFPNGRGLFLWSDMIYLSVATFSGLILGGK